MNHLVHYVLFIPLIWVASAAHGSTDLDRPLSDWLSRSQAVIDPADTKMLDERTIALYRDWRTVRARSAMSEGILRTMRPFLRDDGIRVFRTMMTALGLPTNLNDRQIESFARNPGKRLFTDVLDVMNMLDVPTDGLRSAGIYFVVDAVREIRRFEDSGEGSEHLNEAERVELRNAVEAHLATKLDAVDAGDGWISRTDEHRRLCAAVLMSVPTEDIVTELHRRLVLKKD